MDSDDTQISESNDADFEEVESLTDSNTNESSVIMMSDDDAGDAQDPLEITHEDFVRCEEQLVSQLSEVDNCTDIGDTELEKSKKTLPGETPMPSTSSVTNPYDAILKKIGVDKTFNTFQLQLIDYAEKHPILYDTTYSEDNENRRERIQELWFIFSKTHYPNAPARMCNDSLKSWNRIRLEYFILHKLKDDNKDTELPPPLVKYFDGRLNFLKPMYDYIKRCSFQIYYEANSSLEDVGCLEAVCTPALFVQILIAFVKQNRFIYDVRIRHVETEEGQVLTRARACRRHWEELAINLNTSRQDCESTWTELKVKYLKFLISKNRRQLRKLNQLFFLNEVYEFSNCEGVKISDALTEILRDDNIVGDSISHPENEKAELHNMSSTSRKTYPTILSKRRINLKQVVKQNDKNCIIIDEEDTDKDRYETLETTSNEADLLSNKRKKLSDEMLLEFINDSRYVSNKSKSLVNKETQSDPNVFLNNINLDGENFFEEIGKFVTDHFYEDQQRDIRIKSRALVTQLELEMLEEEEEEEEP